MCFGLINLLGSSVIPIRGKTTMEEEEELVLEIGISALVPALNGFLKDLAADMNSGAKAKEDK